MLKKTKRLFILKSVLFLLYFLILTEKSGSGFPTESFRGIASPYLFSIAAWESKHILYDGWYAIRYGSHTTTDQEDIYLVNRYENLKAEMSNLENILARRSPGINIQSENEMRARLESLDSEKRELQIKVKFVLESQISLILDEEGLVYHFPVIRNISILVPSVAYSPSELPHLLIISPRGKIEMKESVLLVPEMSPKEIESLENTVETRGVSALVDKVGGIATYPSLLSDETNLVSLLEVIAHEWFHQYLFFHSLGWNYQRDYQMTIINETVADISGKEIAEEVLKRYYPETAIKNKRQTPTPRQSVPGIDFNKEMRTIRLKVDSLLLQSKVIEAEKYMEESRINLARDGYFIRKLNQAYFAFYGSYGEAPASTSPIGPMLRQIRESSGSLGNFIRIISAISSSEQLQELAR